MAIDTRFASAYFQLARVMQQLGDRAAADLYRRKMLEHSDRLPERQRMFAEAMTARESGAVEKAARLYEALIARYPDEEVAYNQFANMSLERGDPEKATEVIQQGLKAIPNSGPLHNAYGYRLLLSGRYPDAIREFEEYARLRPKEPNPYDSLAEAYLASGQPEKALEKYAHVLAIDPSYSDAHGARAWAFAMLGRFDEASAELTTMRDTLSRGGLALTGTYLSSAFMAARVGRHRDADANMSRELIEASRTKSADVQVATLLFRSHLAIQQRNYGAASDHARRATDALPSITDQYLRRTFQIYGLFVDGVALARGARLTEAGRRLDELRQVYDAKRPHETWWFHALDAEIALASGDLARAGQAYAAGEPRQKMLASHSLIMLTMMFNDLSFADGPARLAKARGDVAVAISLYRPLIAPDIGNKWTLMLDPRYVLELARLYERHGDVPTAREHYRRFLELWKNADPGQSEVTEAQRKAS